MLQPRRLQVLVGLLTTLLAVVALAVPADAHQPIFVEDTTDPHLVPVIEDGTAAFAVYGTITDPTHVASVRAHLSPGDLLSTSLLIPDLTPETDFAEADLPRLTVVAPDGTTTPLRSTFGPAFEERETGTSYVILAVLREPAQDGMYQFEVRSDRPARFVVTIGEREGGGRVLGYAGAPESALTTWYTTDPPASTGTPRSTDVPRRAHPRVQPGSGDPRDEVDSFAASGLFAPPRGDGQTAPWWILAVTAVMASVVIGLGVAGRAAADRHAARNPGTYRPPS